jgi:hypothetical protein
MVQCIHHYKGVVVVLQSLKDCVLLPELTTVLIEVYNKVVGSVVFIDVLADVSGHVAVLLCCTVELADVFGVALVVVDVVSDVSIIVEVAVVLV